MKNIVFLCKNKKLSLTLTHLFQKMSRFPLEGESWRNSKGCCLVTSWWFWVSILERASLIMGERLHTYDHSLTLQWRELIGPPFYAGCLYSVPVHYWTGCIYYWRTFSPYAGLLIIYKFHLFLNSPQVLDLLMSPILTGCMTQNSILVRGSPLFAAWLLRVASPQYELTIRLKTPSLLLVYHWLHVSHLFCDA